MNSLIKKALDAKSLSFEGKTIEQVKKESYITKLEEMGFQLTMPRKHMFTNEKSAEYLGLVPYEGKVYVYLTPSSAGPYPKVEDGYFDMLYEYFHKRITILELIDYVKQNNIQ